MLPCRHPFPPLLPPSAGWANTYFSSMYRTENEVLYWMVSCAELALSWLAGGRAGDAMLCTPDGAGAGWWPRTLLLASSRFLTLPPACPAVPCLCRCGCRMKRRRAPATTKWRAWVRHQLGAGGRPACLPACPSASLCRSFRWRPTASEEQAPTVESGLAPPIAPPRATSGPLTSQPTPVATAPLLQATATGRGTSTACCAGSSGSPSSRKSWKTAAARRATRRCSSPTTSSGSSDMICVVSGSSVVCA